VQKSRIPTYQRFTYYYIQLTLGSELLPKTEHALPHKTFWQIARLIKFRTTKALDNFVIITPTARTEVSVRVSRVEPSLETSMAVLILIARIHSTFSLRIPHVIDRETLKHIVSQ
jgi:hypothetical protein